MEWLDIVDEQGNPTGRQVERTEAHQKGILHRTSHVWVVREKDGQIEILLQKRSKTKSYPGCFDISSAGHIPAGCGFEESALRELREELGIHADAEELHFCGQRRFRHDEIFFGQRFIDWQVSNVYYIQRDLAPEEFRIQKEELELVRWMELYDCIKAVTENAIKSCIALEELQMLEAALRLG